MLQGTQKQISSDDDDSIYVIFQTYSPEMIPAAYTRAPQCSK